MNKEPTMKKLFIKSLESCVFPDTLGASTRYLLSVIIIQSFSQCFLFVSSSIKWQLPNKSFCKKKVFSWLCRCFYFFFAAIITGRRFSHSLRVFMQLGYNKKKNFPFFLFASVRLNDNLSVEQEGHKVQVKMQLVSLWCKQSQLNILIRL